ncbi:hypothetical protein PIROE2DRAFT_6270, partial [Piromyces sp. E2]
HSETFTEENTKADSISNLLINTFMKDIKVGVLNLPIPNSTFNMSHTNDMSMDKSIKSILLKILIKNQVQEAILRKTAKTIEFHILCMTVEFELTGFAKTSLEWNKEQIEPVIIITGSIHK